MRDRCWYFTLFHFQVLNAMPKSPHLPAFCKFYYFVMFECVCAIAVSCLVISFFHMNVNIDQPEWVKVRRWNAQSSLMSRNGHNNVCNNKQGKIANTLCYCSKWCCPCCIPWDKTELMNAVNLKDYEPIRTAPWSWIYMTNDVQWNCEIGIIHSGVTIVLRWATCGVAKKKLKKLWACRRLKPRRALPYMWIIKPCNSFQVYFIYVRGTNRTLIWPPPRWFDSLDGILLSCAITHNGLESPSSLDVFSELHKRSI